MGSPAINPGQEIIGGTFPPYYWPGGRGMCRAVRSLRAPAVPVVDFPPIPWTGKRDRAWRVEANDDALRHGDSTKLTVKSRGGA